MRLTCPQCDAQYEVDVAVIPPDGRDVQCSNCGHTWFQKPDSTPDDAQPDPLDPDQDTALPGADAALPGPQRRSLDPSVVDLLRQEAELEQSARASASDTFGIESQPDLGLETGTSRHGTPRDRFAEMHGITPPTVQETREQGARRDLLPDVEEINSTLDHAAAEAADMRLDDDTDGDGTRNDFRRGFALVILLATVAVALYAYAPAIGKLHPTLAAGMDRYVAVVDAWRLWANTAIPQALQGITEKLNSLTG